MKKVAIAILCLLFSITISVGHLFGAEKKTWSAKASSQDYQIGAGDILEITTWKEPDFTREEVLVRLDGKLTFPLLNETNLII